MREFDLSKFFDQVKARNTTGWEFVEEPMAGSIFFEMPYSVGSPAVPQVLQVYATPYWGGCEHLAVDVTFGDDAHLNVAIPFDEFSDNYDALADRYMELVKPILAFAKMLALTDARVDVF
ncbi:MAG: hypothetical protein BWY85_00004 [Firmicutes bacterium ADurb.Bin506]|nr:MAG: hypothetical protein BWY85_00004 [Firmicutes bacterium ADurb.Bin506]